MCFCFVHTKTQAANTHASNKMDPVCRLGLRCLKKDEPLEACYSAGCPNSIHPSCFKKVMLAVAEDEWEGLLFCGKRCFNNNKKMQEAAANKSKGRVLDRKSVV